MLVPMRMPPWQKDDFALLLTGLYAFFIIVMYIPPVYRTVYRIVAEKENRAKESMRMMGLKDFPYWASWFMYCQAGIRLICEASIFAQLKRGTFENKNFLAQLKRGTFGNKNFLAQLKWGTFGNKNFLAQLKWGTCSGSLHHREHNHGHNELDRPRRLGLPIHRLVHFFIIWLTMWLYGQSIFGLIMITQSIFTRARAAAITTSLIYFGTSNVLYFVNKEESTTYHKILGSLSPPVAMIQTVGCMARYEQSGVGIRWENVDSMYKEYNVKIGIYIILYDGFQLRLARCSWHIPRTGGS